MSKQIKGDSLEKVPSRLRRTLALIKKGQRFSVEAIRREKKDNLRKVWNKPPVRQFPKYYKRRASCLK